MDKILCLIICLVASTTGELKKCKIDIAFVIDSSSSIFEEDFNLQKTFLSQVVSRFEIGQNKVQVSAVSFSNTIRNEFYFNEAPNLKQALDRISYIPYTAGDATRTYEAIHSMRTSLFSTQHGARNNVMHVGIVLTDGKTNPARYDHITRSAAEARTQNEARAARDEGIMMFAVGIGDETNATELRGIASDPDNQYYIQVADFERLNTEQIINLLTYRACREVSASTTPVPEITTISTERPIPENCQNKAADVMFLLDQSTSIGSDENFQKELDFVNEVIDFFDISPAKTQVSILKFSSNSEIAFAFNRYSDKASLKQAVNNLSWGHGDTYTNEALEQMMKDGFSTRNGQRENVPKIAIVITDGNSTDPSATSRMAQKAKNSGITIFAIGIGKVYRQELIDIASAPASKYVNSVTGLDRLTSLKSELAYGICKTNETDPNPCASGVADIVFVADASTSIGQADFEKEMKFIGHLANQFAVSSDGVRVGLITFSNYSKVEFHLNQLPTATDIIAHLPYIHYTTGLTFANNGLLRMLDEFESFGRWDWVPKIGIFITDGVARDTDQAHETAKLIKDKNIKLFTIGVGRYTAPEELRRMASFPPEIFFHNVEDFSSFSDIDQLIVHGACGLSMNSPKIMKNQDENLLNILLRALETKI